MRAGEKISEELSEVDLSNPEDVKALIPDHCGRRCWCTLARRTFWSGITSTRRTWRSGGRSIRSLTSVDMRYDRQAVLEMQPGSAVPVSGFECVPAGELVRGVRRLRVRRQLCDSLRDMRSWLSLPAEGASG